MLKEKKKIQKFETFASNWHSGKFFNHIDVIGQKRVMFLVDAVCIYLQDNPIVALSKDGREILSSPLYMICILEKALYKLNELCKTIVLL